MDGKPVSNGSPMPLQEKWNLAVYSNGGYILDTEQYINTTYLPLEREE